MDFLMIKTNSLKRRICHECNRTGSRRQAKAFMSALLAELCLQQPFDCVDNFVHRIGTAVRQPKGLSSRLLNGCRQEQALAKIINIAHRAQIFPGSYNGRLASANHAEKLALAWWLIRTIKPWRPDNDSFDFTASLALPHTKFHLHL